MDLEPGYTLSETWIQRLAILDWIADNGGMDASQPTSVGPLFAEHDEPGQHRLAADLRDFSDRGWLVLHQALGFDGWTCMLTPAGIDFVDDVRRRRGDPVARRKATRDAVLRWLYERATAGVEAPPIDSFATDTLSYFYGHPFTATEITSATTWLKEQGYLTGTGAWGGGVPRPRITPKGEQVVESGRSVNEVDASAAAAADAAAPGIMIMNSSNVNVASQSPGAEQSVTLTSEHRQEVVKVADALEGVRGSLGLDADRTAELDRLVGDLRAVGRADGPDRGHVRKLLDAAKEIAVSGTGSAVGTAIVALVHQVMQTVGLG